MWSATLPLSDNVRFARFAGGTSVGFWLIFGEIEMANIMTELLGAVNKTLA